MNDAKRQTFATAVVKTRILEKRLIGRGLMEKLLAEQSPRRMEAALQAAGYQGITPGVLDKSNFDALLRGALEGFAQQVLDITPDREILDLLFLEYDIFNIKALLMREDTGVSFDGDLARIPADRAARYRLLAEGAQSTGDAFFDALFLDARALYLEKGAKAVQEVLDRRYFQELLRMARESGVPLCLKYAQAKIDFYNILCMLRLARMASAQAPAPGAGEMHKLYGRILVPGGTIPLEAVEGMHGASFKQWILLADGTVYRGCLVEGLRGYSYGRDLTDLEKRMDDYLTELMKSHQFVTLGPEPLLCYLYGRRIEVLNLRLVLTSLFLGVPRHVIAERLRESYA